MIANYIVKIIFIYKNKNVFHKDVYCPLFTETTPGQRPPGQRPPNRDPPNKDPLDRDPCQIETP